MSNGQQNAPQAPAQGQPPVQQAPQPAPQQPAQSVSQWSAGKVVSIIAIFLAAVVGMGLMIYFAPKRDGATRPDENIAGKDADGDRSTLGVMLGQILGKKELKKITRGPHEVTVKTPEDTLTLSVKYEKKPDATHPDAKRGWLAEADTRALAIIEDKYGKAWQPEIKVLGDRVTSVESKVDTVTTRVDTVDKKVDGVNTRLEGVGKKQEDIEHRMTAVEGKIGDVSKKVDDKFDALNKEREKERKDDRKSADEKHQELLKALLKSASGSPPPSPSPSTSGPPQS